MARQRDKGEMFRLVNGKKEDADLHAEILGDDEDYAYDGADLPSLDGMSPEQIGQAIERARELYRQRRQR